MRSLPHVNKARCSVLTIMVVAAFPAFASIPRHRFLNGDTRYTNDALDRLVSRSAESVSSVPSVDAFSYDAVGNLLTASNAVARETFTYDVMDRLTTAATALSNAVFTAAYARDAGGLVTNLVCAPGKAVTRTYDTDGRLTTVSDWLGHTWSFTHDGASKPTSVLSPGGIAATNRYDAAGRLESWSVGTLAGRAITRDAAGLKIREEITAGPYPAPAFVRYATNTFDAADRLIAASVRYGSHTNAPVSETYLYDGNGALTNVQLEGHLLSYPENVMLSGSVEKMNVSTIEFDREPSSVEELWEIRLPPENR